MDKILRTITSDGSLMASAIDSSQIVYTAQKIHGLTKTSCAALGRLLTGASLMGNMLKTDGASLTLKVNGGGPLGNLVAISDSHGNVRGYVDFPEVELPLKPNGKIDVGGGVGNQGRLAVIRDLGEGDPYVGQVELVSGEIAEDLTYYYATSEQTPSSVALGVLMNKDNTVRQAGGFIIQLMPGASEEIITKLEMKLGEIQSVTSLMDVGNTPEMILEHILGEFGLEIGEKIPTSFYCNCTKERVEKAIISIGREEISQMIADGKPIEVNCHFCGKNYEFTVAELEDMLAKATH